jgi:predicted nucleotidyltransferase
VNAIRDVLNRDPRIAYALLFGSSARGTSHQESDVDVAVGLATGVSMSPADTGALIADLEQAAGRNVDLVFVHEAPPALAYRIFRDGAILIERDHGAMTEHKVRAILDYLDFRPIEDIAVKGVLAAAARGR